MMDRPNLYQLENFLLRLSSRISDLGQRVERLERVVSDMRYRGMKGVVEVGSDVYGDGE